MNERNNMKYLLLVIAALSVGCSKTEYNKNGTEQIGLKYTNKLRMPDGHDYWWYCGGLAHAQDCETCQEPLAEIGGN